VIYTTQRRQFVYDTWDNGSRLNRVVVECTLSITHCLRLNLQLHTIDLVRTCRISSFCTAVWQLARFQLTRRIERSLGDSWASCRDIAGYLSKVADFDPPHLHLAPPYEVTPDELRGDLRPQKTRLPRLSCRVVWVILCFAVLVELRLVSDRQTDRHWRTQGHSIYRGCIASRGKSRCVDIIRLV